MNYRLPNPSTDKYRDNWDRIFRGEKCDKCSCQLHITPWQLAHNADEQWRHKVCHKCHTVYVEQRTTSSVTKTP
jgi:hypothetical protein